jgi:hypothetical protein
MFNDNPYRSPCDVQPGEYDHTLFLRLVKILCAFVLFFVLLDVVAWSQYKGRGVHRDYSTYQAVVEFFRSWDRGLADPTQTESEQPQGEP